MKLSGITAEYNPLHNGHVYHISETRRLTGCDAVVAALSGDFVQRGEPAILDKWTRAAFALECGADLVVEIPVLFCLGNASQYASASVCILEALGCSHIAFGSECGDAELIRSVSNVLMAEADRLNEGIRARIKQGLSYPSARGEAFLEIRRDEGVPEERASEEITLLSGPNDILALEYIMNMKKASPIAIKRKGSGYGEGIRPESRMQSASGIRSAIASYEDIREYVPECTFKALSIQKPVFSDDCLKLVRYAALSGDPSRMDDCPSGGEGLGGLLKSAARSASSMEDLILSVKSKRYTYTRISRLCMQMLLGISRTDYPFEKPLYIRVLGFNERGRRALAELKTEGCALPLINNVNKEAPGLSEEALRMLGLDMHAADIYNLIRDCDLRECSDQRHRVIIR